MVIVAGVGAALPSDTWTVNVSVPWKLRSGTYTTSGPEPKIDPVAGPTGDAPGEEVAVDVAGGDAEERGRVLVDREGLVGAITGASFTGWT